MHIWLQTASGSVLSWPQVLYVLTAMVLHPESIFRLLHVQQGCMRCCKVYRSTANISPHHCKLQLCYTLILSCINQIWASGYCSCMWTHCALPRLNSRSARLLLCCRGMHVILCLIAYCAITNRFTNTFWSPAPAPSSVFTLHDPKVIARFLKESRTFAYMVIAAAK